MTPDGRTIVSVLLLNGVETLLGLDAATGKVLYRTTIAGGSYGVDVSGNSQFVLSSSDSQAGGRKALVFDARTGAPRGTTGCESPWNIPPAISFAGDFLLTGDQNGLRLCAWDAGAKSYAPDIAIGIPAIGQEYWFPVQTAILNTTVGGSPHQYGGATFFDGNYKFSRFYAVDLDAAAAGSQSYIVIDHTQDILTHGIPTSLVLPAGPYFVAASAGGNGNGTQPTLFLYEAGTPDAPALDALWNLTTAGLANNLATLVVSATATNVDMHVLVATGGETPSGGSGNGGAALWLEINVASHERVRGGDHA
jgi:hypothetical protein